MITTTTTDKATEVLTSLNVALLTIATAQLMLVLDDTIANIALPSIQQQFGVPPALLPWIINAYILAFGGLLLLGGRLGDLFGRKKIFQTGVLIFTGASLIGGLGVNAEMLIAARAFQGIGAALTAPNALALIATTFPIGKSRNSAMALYGAMSAVGIIAGVLLGGFLTAMLGWRSVFFINVPIGLAVFAGSRSLNEAKKNPGRVNMIDAITGTGAMISLAYAITNVAEHGWNDIVTIGLFILGAVLAGIFITLQARRTNPMLPLDLFADRNRTGSYMTMLFFGAGMMGTFYLIALYFQQVLHYSPLETGLKSLPFGAGIIVAAGIASKLVERVSPRLIAGPGLLLSAIGMFWLSGISTSTQYFFHIMPAVFMIAAGLGFAAVPMTLTAVHKVGNERAGVASSLVNMAQQIGAGLGLAIFTTIAMTSATSKFPEAMSKVTKSFSHGHATGLDSDTAQALTHGYSTAFEYGSFLLVLISILVLIAVNTKDSQQSVSTTNK